VQAILPGDGEILRVYFIKTDRFESIGHISHSHGRWGSRRNLCLAFQLLSLPSAESCGACQRIIHNALHIYIKLNPNYACRSFSLENSGECCDAQGRLPEGLSALTGLEGLDILGGVPTAALPPTLALPSLQHLRVEILPNEQITNSLAIASEDLTSLEIQGGKKVKLPPPLPPHSLL